VKGVTCEDFVEVTVRHRLIAAIVALRYSVTGK